MHAVLRSPSLSEIKTRALRAQFACNAMNQVGHRDIVAIAASAGGVEATCRLLALLPQDLPAAVLVVLHRAPEGDNHLSGVLARATKLKVVRPHEGGNLLHGAVYVAEPNEHLTIAPQGRIRLIRDAFYRAHTIDAFFCSLAVNAPSRTIGIVLSGALSDGAFGLRAIKDAGGASLAQDMGDASFTDAPANTISPDGVDLMGSLEDLAAKICELTGAHGLRLAALN